MACYEVIPAAWARSNMADVCVEEKRFQWRMEIKRKDDRDIIWHTTNHMMSIFMYFFWFDRQWDLPNSDWLAWSFLFSKVGGRPHLGQVHALNLPRVGKNTIESIGWWMYTSTKMGRRKDIHWDAMAQVLFPKGVPKGQIGTPSSAILSGLTFSTKMRGKIMSQIVEILSASLEILPFSTSHIPDFCVHWT